MAFHSFCIAGSEKSLQVSAWVAFIIWRSWDAPVPGFNPAFNSTCAVVPPFVHVTLSTLALAVEALGTKEDFLESPDLAPTGR